jgi:hypothetical protein
LTDILNVRQPAVFKKELHDSHQRLRGDIRTSNLDLQSQLSAAVEMAIRPLHKEMVSLRQNFMNTVDVKNFVRDSASSSGALLTTVNNSVSRCLSQMTRMKLLAALDFDRINDRYHKIEEAHRNTLKWFLRSDPQHQATWPCFPSWLMAKEDSQNIYWVTGE